MNKLRSLTGKENPWIIALIMFLISVLLGGVFAKILCALQIGGIDSINSRYFSTILSMDIDYSDLFGYIYFGLLKKFFFLWMISLTVLGLFFLCISIIGSGFSFGFLTMILIYKYGGKGILLMLVYQFPHGLIYLPAAYLTLKYCYQLTMECNHGENPPSFQNIILLKKYGKIILILIACLTAGTLLETFVGSFLLRRVLTLF